MKIAVWDTPFTSLALRALERAAPGMVTGGSATEVEVLLRAGKVDIAMIPTHRALMAGDDFDVLPAVGVSTWSNPFTTLGLPAGLDGKTVLIQCHADAALAALVAKIILKEHYGIIAAVTASTDPSPDVSRFSLSTQGHETDADAMLLDLGQEWYELANYPMVWSVFVMRKGEVEDRHIEYVRDALVELDENRRDMVLAAAGDDDMQMFELNELRLRMDDLAIASLTELGEYMYFYDLKESIDPVAFASLSSAE